MSKKVLKIKRSKQVKWCVTRFRLDKIGNCVSVLILIAHFMGYILKFQAKFKALFEWQHVIDLFYTCFKRRERHDRILIWLIIFTLASAMFVLRTSFPFRFFILHNWNIVTIIIDLCFQLTIYRRINCNQLLICTREIQMDDHRIQSVRCIQCCLSNCWQYIWRVCSESNAWRQCANIGHGRVFQCNDRIYCGWCSYLFVAIVCW